MRDRLYIAISRAKFAAVGAAIGGGAGGLVSKNAASTGAAVGALLGAVLGEKRVTIRTFVSDVKARKEELNPVERRS